MFQFPKPRLPRPRILAGLLIVGLGIWILVQIDESKLAYFVIASESMEPALKIGDRVVMKKSERYAVGDIVVFNQEQAVGETLVKRIIAAEGNVVYADGDQIEVTKPDRPHTAGSKDEKSWTIGPGEVFVAGDNRTVSKDSRVYGPIQITAIRGKVRYRKISLFNWETVK